MSDTRDERIEKRLEKMSTLFEHSDKKEQKSEAIKLEEAKSDILNELPADVVRYLLREGYPYGDNIESLRNAYIDYKKEHAKLEYQASGHFENKERRQDNVREYEFLIKIVSAKEIFIVQDHAAMNEA